MKDNLITQAQLKNVISQIRGINVIFDFDIASLYGVETRVLLQAVRRNIERFPDDFMFELTSEELENWRSQFVMSNPNAKMGLRRKPFVFTEQGVAMLSSVLRSPQAIKVNIELMRSFVRLKEMVGLNRELEYKLVDLESKYDSQFSQVFDAIKQLMEPPLKKKRPIGFGKEEQWKELEND